MMLWTEVVCSVCSRTTAGEWARWGKRSAKSVKAELKEEGWQVSDGEATCLDCLAKTHDGQHP